MLSTTFIHRDEEYTLLLTVDEVHIDCRFSVKLADRIHNVRDVLFGELLALTTMNTLELHTDEVVWQGKGYRWGRDPAPMSGYGGQGFTMTFGLETDHRLSDHWVRDYTFPIYNNDHLRACVSLVRTYFVDM